MRLVTIKGKQYELKFTYKSIMSLEAAWKQPYYEVLSGNRFETLYKMLWACFRNIEDFENMTPMQVVDLLDELADEQNIVELAEMVEEAVAESTIVRELIKQSTPYDKGEEA